MKRIQKCTAILLAVLLLFTVLPFSVSASESKTEAVGTGSGTTGDCAWTVDDDGVLTVSGNGDMANYSSSSPAPWGTEITGVVIENGVTSIGNYAFRNCAALTGAAIADSVTKIKYGAFYRCTALTDLVIPGTITSIPDNAFYGCSSLTSVTISDGVISIGDSAFYGCSSLTSVTIPDGVISIGHSAFYSCTNLTDVSVPDSVTHIGSYAFGGGTAWMGNQPEGMVYLGKVAYLYKGAMPQKACVVIRDGIVEIAANAFWMESNLTSIILPDSVKQIGEFAFCYCSGLESIAFPDGLEEIGACAFQGCSSLGAIILLNENTFIHTNGDAFDHGVILGLSGSTAEEYVEYLDGLECGSNVMFQECDRWICSGCGKQRTVDRLEVVHAVPATYTQNGATDGIRCAECGTWIWEPRVITKKTVDFVYGDTNDDGKTNVNDATVIQRHLAQIETFDERMQGAADVNADGVVDINDVTVLMRYLAEFDETLGAA